MLNLSNKKRKNNMRKKHSTNKTKNTETKSEYQEDFNDIILNDLVPEENRSEFGLDDVETSAKKSSGLNLGLKKKSPKKSKSSKTENNEKSSGKEKSINKEKTTNKEKSSSKDTSSNKKSKTSPDKKAGSKKQPKQKNISKDDTNTNLDEVNNTKQINKTNPKNKHHNGNSKKRRVKHTKEEEIETRDEDLRNFEDIELENDFMDEGPMTFRSSNVDNIINPDTLENHNNKKMGNLIWSEDKFPKK